jgi:hypothetical protein
MLNGNTGEFRLSEDKAFIESMNQTQASTMFYGNPGTDPRQYLGLASRYGTISGAGNAQNIIDAGGTSTNNTSIYLVGWGEETVFCTFPKGSHGRPAPRRTWASRRCTAPTPPATRRACRRW